MLQFVSVNYVLQSDSDSDVRFTNIMNTDSYMYTLVHIPAQII